LDTHLSGSIELSQMVLASFAAGAGIGLLVFGELGSRFSQHRLILFSLSVYCAASIVATLAESMLQLVVVRFFQGFAASAPAVFAPGMVRALFDDRRAMRAMGLMGSLESLVPAFAPILGAWLISQYHWQATFYVTAAAALLLIFGWLIKRPPVNTNVQAVTLSYLELIRKPLFFRYALSHALTLGGLIAFVFGAPTVIVHSMGGSLSDFIVMQIAGISLFMVCANTAHLLSDRIGRESTIILGSTLAVAGSGSMLIYAYLFENHTPVVLWVLFALMNMGVGIRGPGGFFMAMYASGNNDSKAAAVVMLSVFLIAAGTTTIVAPYITMGLLPLAGITTVICAASLLVLRLMPGVPEGEFKEI
ncbi:MAG: MFS transporter, partial [Pseudomonadales bacterium]